MTTTKPIDQPSQPEDRNRPPTLTIDWDLYGHYLDESDLPEADKRLLIETLWSIVVSFVDLGFRLGPVADSCGQAGRPDTDAGAAVLDCGNTTTTQAFEGAAVDSPVSSSARRRDAS